MESKMKTKMTLKAKIDNAIETAFATALADAQAVAEGIFKTDRNGNKVRVFTKENPCTKDIVRNAVVGNRGVSKEEMLEQIGDQMLNYLVKLGYLVKDQKNAYYHVTAEMAASYNFPRVNGMPFFSYKRLTGKELVNGWAV
jgi:hypothetical protein